MKKLMIVFIFCVCLGVISGCGKKSEMIECTLLQKDTSYELNSTFKIKIAGDIVDTIEIVEMITSKDKTVLDALESAANKQYKSKNDLYGGYTYKVTNDGTKVDSKATINFNQVNIKQFAEDNAILKKYIDKKNHMKVDGVVAMYEALGAVCKK